jgi:chemotaxis protein CheD
MLPLSSIDPAKALENPYMFVDTGVPRLFLSCYRAGAAKERLLVKVVGGARAGGNDQDDYFQIGKRNFIALRQLLWKNGVPINAYDVAGSYSRTMSLEIGSGEVLVIVDGSLRPL